MFQILFNSFFLTIIIIVISSLNEMFLKIINITKVSFCFILMNLIKRYDTKNNQNLEIIFENPRILQIF